MTHMITPLISLKNAGITYKTQTGLFSANYFKALQNINLDIMAGETLGVIGANGSGKSTLLKLLARIYQPDSGTVHYRAKNVSLLSLSFQFSLLFQPLQLLQLLVLPQPLLQFQLSFFL